MDSKLPYKIFGLVILFVSIITFFIMNYNSVPVSFIFFTLKVPLTIIFFICFLVGGLLMYVYHYTRYKTLERKLEKTKKLLFTKEKLDQELEKEV